MIRIRRYSQEDKNSLLKILETNIPQYFHSSELEDYSQYLDDEIEEYFVVSNLDVIVAAGGINYQHENSLAIISWDIVESNKQGLGYGGILLQHRLKLIKDQYPTYHIRVRTSQLVYKFYAKYGFHLEFIQKDYWAAGYDLYHMEMANTLF